MIVQYGLGFIAGILSLLAPCVLPILPILIGSSLRSSKLGPYAMALGLTLSFTFFGIVTSAFSSLFDVDVIQKIGAVILVLVGIVFIIPSLKDKITTKLGFLSSKGNDIQQKIESKGLLSEFLVGGTLGMIWAPCSGPTLAFAFGIATQSGKMLHASIIFFFFGLGAGLGLVVLGLLVSKFSVITKALLNNANTINKLLGVASLSMGILILTGTLPIVEEAILQITPDFITKLTTKF